MPTNLLTDPLFATDVTVPGLADHWTALRNTVTAPVFSLVTGGQSMVYAGEGSDTGSQYAGFYQNSAPGSFAPGQTAAFSAVLSGTCTGGIAQVNLIACTSGGGYIAEVDLTVALTSVPTLFTASYANLPATTSYVQVFIVAVNLTSAAVVNIVTNDAALLLGNVVTVTGTIGPAADGATATFMPIGFGTQLFWDQDGLLQVSATATAPATVNAVCDVNGSFSAVLFATDNLEAVSGPLPAGWTWTLNVIAPASGQPAGVNPSQVLYTANTFYVSYANGATQELSEILPLPAPGASVSLIGEILRAEASETLITSDLLYETSRAEAAETAAASLAASGGTINGSVTVAGDAQVNGALSVNSNFSAGGSAQINGGFSAGAFSQTEALLVGTTFQFNGAGSALALLTGTTIDPGTVAQTNIAVVCSANVTGIIMATDVGDGFVCNVINTTGFTITFAAAATSNVADGVLDVIPAHTNRLFVYDQTTNLWYRSG